MKKILTSIFLGFLLSGCSGSHVTPDQLTLLERQEALAEWKQSQITTDGCSSPRYINWLVTTLNVRNWEDCCYQHDFDYHYGAVYQITREMADDELYECVNDSDHPGTAVVMWLAVRLFGGSSYEEGEE